MKADRHVSARWRNLRMDLHFDGDYRIGSNTYEIIASDCEAMAEPDSTFLQASYMWSESEFRRTMTFQEFIAKTLGKS